MTAILIVLLIICALVGVKYLRGRRGGVSCALCGCWLEWNPVRRRIWNAHRVAFCASCMPGPTQSGLAETEAQGIRRLTTQCPACHLVFGVGREHWCQELGRVMPYSELCLRKRGQDDLQRRPYSGHE